MMTIVASRMLSSEDVCFVGIGAPSAACNLARLTHAPGITLVYESGTIGTRPDALPLSIGDGELCETALTTCSVPEMFRYWVMGGRMTIGFLGAAQIDRFANLNTTVLGQYRSPTIRLPGAGGAPEAAIGCQEIFVVIEHSTRRMVGQLDFLTSFGHGTGGNSRAELGFRTKGPTNVITDLCLMRPNAETRELEVVSLHPGVTRDSASAATGWSLRFAHNVDETPHPTVDELRVLRELNARSPQRSH
jgi:glutaconate CoA-transferase, subunit B